MSYVIKIKNNNANGLRVVLLSLNWYRRKDPRLPLGMGYIYSELMNTTKDFATVGVELLEYDVRDNLSDAVHQIMTIAPDILGIGVYAWNNEAVGKILSSLQKLGCKPLVVLGGPEITYGGNELKVEFPTADYFVKGYGESAFAEIVKSVIEKRTPIFPGIYKKGAMLGEILASPSSGIKSSPFSKPQLAKSLLGHNFLRWQTQRGCVFRCTFCAFKSPNGAIVESDIKTVAFELKKIKEMGIRKVAVLDPVFFLNRNRSIEILRLMASITPDVEYSIQSRFEHLDSTIIDILALMNVKLECGLQTLDREVQKSIKRVNNLQKVQESIEMLVSNKIRFETHLIYGLPNQVMKSFASDVFSLNKMGCKKLRIFPLSLLRGTGIANSFENNEGEILFSTIFPREVIATKWMNRDEVFFLKGIQKKMEDSSHSISFAVKSLRDYEMEVKNYA